MGICKIKAKWSFRESKCSSLYTRRPILSWGQSSGSVIHAGAFKTGSSLKVENLLLINCFVSSIRVSLVVSKELSSQIFLDRLASLKLKSAPSNCSNDLRCCPDIILKASKLGVSVLILSETYVIVLSSLWKTSETFLTCWMMSKRKQRNLTNIK